MFELVTETLTTPEEKWTHEEMSVLLLKHTIKSCNIDLAAHGLDPVTLLIREPSSIQQPSMTTFYSLAPHPTTLYSLAPASFPA